MATYIGIGGEPGSGKSTSFRTLDPETTVFLCPNKKRLPFPGNNKYNEEAGNRFTLQTIGQIGGGLRKLSDTRPEVQNIVVEDLTHYFSKRVMDDAQISGYQKWADMAGDVFDSIVNAEHELRDDLFVWWVWHLSTYRNAQGVEATKMLTPGRFLDEKVMLPSYFTFVMNTRILAEGGEMRHVFVTRNDGTNEAKSPMGCLEQYEDNDALALRQKIEAYYNGGE